MSTDRGERARELDASDPLARFRSQFVLPVDGGGRPLIYLCGHSLGLAPRSARAWVNAELTDWEQMGVAGHHAATRPWIDYAEHLRKPLAELAGAGESEVVAMNSLSVNLHLLLASFYRPQGRRRCILIERGAFPSDRHAVTSQIAWHGLDPEDALIEAGADPGLASTDEGSIEKLLRERGEEIALVLWPGVQYLSGQRYDIGRLTRAAHHAGALCGLDLAHAIGNVPLDLHGDDADFAVWCGYKYLNGGPGTLGGAFVHQRHSRADVPGLAGWWGHDPATRFNMAPEFVPAAGAAGWQVSNPPILSAAALLASLQMFSAAGMTALQAKAQAMGALLLDTFDALDTRLACITPRNPRQRGCQLSLRVREGRDAGKQLFEALRAQGVVIDWREPDILRLAPVPLYNSYSEVARFCELLESALEQIA